MIFELAIEEDFLWPPVLLEVDETPPVVALTERLFGMLARAQEGIRSEQIELFTYFQLLKRFALFEFSKRLPACQTLKS